MVSELSTLHTFVQGGESRKPSDQIDIATLGAQLRRDEKAGGYVVEHNYLHDPDLANQAPPLARPDSRVKEGEVIVSIDGQSLLSVSDERALLRGKAGRWSCCGSSPPPVNPATCSQPPSKTVMSSSSVTRSGSIHAASKWKPTQTARSATFTCRPWAPATSINGRASITPSIIARASSSTCATITAVTSIHGSSANCCARHGSTGSPRVGKPDWNMQYAFRGHIVVLCDRETASDGEAFTEGFKRFNLGKVIGTRTWGGEIWLSGSNVQADNGIATAAETGVYGPEGKWLIEGHGVEPDIVVDDLPHASFAGFDAQLQATIELLKKEIQADPRPVPSHPPYPDKSFTYRP
jgi:tricorn protease